MKLEREVHLNIELKGVSSTDALTQTIEYMNRYI